MAGSFLELCFHTTPPPAWRRSVAETPEYIRCVEKLLPAADRMEVVEYLAANPKAGDLMQGTGGVRKLR
jgi:hypothetical protein